MTSGSGSSVGDVVGDLGDPDVAALVALPDRAERDDVGVGSRGSPRSRRPSRHRCDSANRRPGSRRRRVAGAVASVAALEATRSEGQPDGQPRMRGTSCGHHACPREPAGIPRWGYAAPGPTGHGNTERPVAESWGPTDGSTRTGRTNGSFDDGPIDPSSRSRPRGRPPRHRTHGRAGLRLRRPDRAERRGQPAPDDDPGRLPRRRGALHHGLPVRRRRRGVRVVDATPRDPVERREGRRLDPPAAHPRDRAAAGASLAERCRAAPPARPRS